MYFQISSYQILSIMSNSLLWISLQSQREPFFSDTQPISLHDGTANIPYRICACNLGFIISDNMTLDMQISTVYCSAFVEIRQN